MGYYLNVEEGTKREWLEKYGREVPSATYELEEDEVRVCLVLNSAFDAAGVVFSEAELEVFADPTDPRPKWWFAVTDERLAPYVAGWDRIPWNL